MSLTSIWDEAVAMSEHLPTGSYAVVPFSLVSNQENQVVGYAGGSLRLSTPPVPLSHRRTLSTETRHLFSDRTSRLGCPEPPPLPGGFQDDPRPLTPFAADKSDRVSLSLRPPQLGQEAPGGWRLTLTLHSWGDGRVVVPLTDGPAGLAVGVGAGIGPVASASYLLALGHARVARDEPIVR